MLILALALPSLAFAPTGDPVEPGYLQTYTAGIQNRLRHQPNWVEFIAGEGKGWQARFDEQTGTPFRAYGPGIPMGIDQSASAGKAEAAVRGFLSRTGLAGVPDSELVLKTASYVPETDIWYVELDRLVNGVPLYRGGVTARIKGGKLVLFGIQTWPELQSLPAATITQAQAFELAAVQGPVQLAARTDLGASLVAVPLKRDSGVEVVLAWMVRSESQEPLGKWVSFVDARSGELLAYYNEIRFFSGTVSGYHHTRTLDGDFSTSPMPLMNISSDNGSRTTTDEAGRYSLDGGSLLAELQGEYLTILNDQGDEGILEFSGNNSSPTWTEEDATFAEIDSYISLHAVRDWGLLVAPEVQMNTEPLTARVNQRGICNAYYDGNVNFYREGNGCNNTGEIADVAYHEWGHGFHYYSLVAGTFDGTLSEGLSDCVAFFQTLDPIIAPYFQTNGNGIRDVADDRVYPDDVVGEVHTDGLIFAGAVWDMLELMAEHYNERPYVDKGDGWLATATIFKDAIKAGPSLETVFDEFIVVDDDDGDLSNGTPHICEIVEAFGRHGLGFAAGTGLVSFDHLALGNQPAKAPIAISASLLNSAPQCSAFAVSNASIHYSVDGGASWEEAPLSGDPSLNGEIPAQDANTIVQYYLQVAGDDGTEIMWPPGGTIAPYTFYVGELTEVWCENFSESDGGFTHALLAGNEQEGADDWVYGRPGGQSNDPTAAYSGAMVWGNDRGGGNYNGAYQPNITNRLSSVPIDTQGNSSLLLQYRRWLNVEDGVYDRARVYANEGVVWENHVGSGRSSDEHTQDVDWVLHTIRLENVSSPLTLGWELESDGGLEFGGWNIDDICLYSYEGGSVITDDTGVAADDSDTIPGNQDSETIKLSGSCGCSSGGGIGGGLLVLGALAVGRRRRV
jgi:MYXO-CTERM domain-containing protein